MQITFHEYDGTNADFVGYRDCLDGFYRGTHPYPEHFQKDFIDGLVQRGELILTLAKDETGRVVGTSAAQLMKGTFENSVLLGMRYVEPCCQGMGVGKNQELFLLDLVHKRYADAVSIYADVVTNNIISQRTLLHNGFAFCGINMMFYYEKYYESKYPEDDFKLTMTVYAKALNKDLRTVYVPEAYADDVKRIYKDLDVPCRIAQASAPENTAFEQTVMAPHKTAEFFISQAGREHSGLDKAVEEALAGGNTISAYINVAVPGADVLCAALEKKGFYFCGMKPMNEGKEYIIMCQTENHPGDIRNIQIPPQNKLFLEKILGGTQ